MVIWCLARETPNQRWLRSPVQIERPAPLGICACARQSGTKKGHAFDQLDTRWEGGVSLFFALGGKHVLIVSTLGKAYWQSGVLDAETMRFHLEQAGMLDYGSFYAPRPSWINLETAFFGSKSRRLRPLEESEKSAGWAGVMSLPRVFTLGSDGELKYSVATEVNTLRGREQTLDMTADEDQKRRPIKAMRLRGLLWRNFVRDAAHCRTIRAMLGGFAANAAPWLMVKYDPQHTNQISIDARPLPITLGDREHLELHFYIDRSVIEVFVNDQVPAPGVSSTRAAMRRIYA